MMFPSAWDKCLCLNVIQKASIVLCFKDLSLVGSSGCGDISIRAHAGASALDVLPKDSIAVGVGPRLQRLLCGLLVLFFAQPSYNACLLECLTIRERQVPRQLPLVKLVHFIKVGSCRFLIIFIRGSVSRQEEDTWHC